ncbi:MAG TPA: hypothetical protein VJB57_19435 [Dehalococcoidia bacterium]|nr:hypothetical protein [Dehalococcoidia bacterium]
MPIQITGKFTPSGGAGAFNLLDIADLEAAGTWKLLYVNGSNEVIELSLGADGTFLQANGVAAAPTFAALVDGDIPATHSGSAHHTRLHAVTDVSDHSASNWKLLYTNGSGQVIELSLGAAATFLRSAGASSAPTMSAIVAGDLPGRTETLLLMAQSGEPSTTSPCGDRTQVEPFSGIDVWHLPFDQTSQEYAFWQIIMPDNWDAGTVTARFVWSCATASATGVRWGLAGASHGDGVALNLGFGTAQEVSDTGNASGNVVLISAATSAITIAGAGAGELVLFRAYRLPTHADDTLAADARLHGIQIEYTTSSYSA